jgi:hypothetical protein
MHRLHPELHYMHEHFSCCVAQQKTTTQSSSGGWFERSSVLSLQLITAQQVLFLAFWQKLIPACGVREYFPTTDWKGSILLEQDTSPPN